MDTIQITLPDGSTRQVPRGTTPLEIARQISPRLAGAALVARVSVGAGGGVAGPTGMVSDGAELV
ncbi:MAG: TGS domain-containing protein, partial [Acidobacteria bacterium]|nr:TGS domain-containing protein [Acidobacteriota bacterium]